MTAPKYFPMTICCRVSGLVSNNSKVPDFNSSLNARIQTAGIKNNNTQGANSKKGERSANPLSSILKLPLKTHKNNPLIIKNIEITRYPIVLEKNEFISRLIIDIIVYFVAGLVAVCLSDFCDQDLCKPVQCVDAPRLGRILKKRFRLTPHGFKQGTVSIVF